MDNFELIFDSMTKNYNDLEQLIEFIYQQTKENLDDYNSQNLLQGLKNIAKNMISSQKEFILAYCDEGLKKTLINKLSKKQNDLSESFES